MTTIVSGSSITFNDNTTQNTSAYGGGFAFRNRIINGGMVIDQRNAGASVSPLDTYTLDRWVGYASVASKYTVQQNAGSVTPPSGFTNYLGVTSSSAYTVGAAERFAVAQSIEGFNSADLDWGTANAKTITLSFWVRSSLTGTFGGSVLNSGYTRSYPFTYTISSSNTWEYKTVTITGDTSGTWLTTNGVGIRLWFGLGVGSTSSGTAGSWSGSAFLSATGATSVVGTNGATFYITGVQLEKGSTATSFDYRPYGTELALCQRYCYGQYNSTGQAYYFYGTTSMISTTLAYGAIFFPVTMRTKPSITTTVSNTFFVDDFTPNSNAVILDQAGVNGGFVAIAGSGGTIGRAGRLLSDNTDQALIIWSAEL